MAQAYVFSATAQTWGGGPSADNIEAAFAAVQTSLALDPSISLGWAGTQARIVRTGGLVASLSVTPSNTTNATRVWEFPDGRPLSSITPLLSMIENALQTSLDSNAPATSWANSTGWVLVPPVAFNANVNGNLADWEDDVMAQTQTRTGPNALTNAVPENPIGPTVAGVNTNQAVGTGVGSAISNLLPSWLPWVLVAGAVAVVAVEVAPLIGAAASLAPRRVPPPAPTPPARRGQGRTGGSLGARATASNPRRRRAQR